MSDEKPTTKSHPFAWAAAGILVLCLLPAIYFGAAGFIAGMLYHCGVPEDTLRTAFAPVVMLTEQWTAYDEFLDRQFKLIGVP